jgi:hypothetical protein
MPEDLEQTTITRIVPSHTLQARHLVDLIHPESLLRINTMYCRRADGSEFREHFISVTAARFEMLGGLEDPDWETDHA